MLNTQKIVMVVPVMLIGPLNHWLLVKVKAGYVVPSPFALYAIDVFAIASCRFPDLSLQTPMLVPVPLVVFITND